jgi:hypothetical protein
MSSVSPEEVVLCGENEKTAWSRSRGNAIDEDLPKKGSLRQARAL